MSREGSFVYSDTTEMRSFSGTSKTSVSGRTASGVDCRMPLSECGSQVLILHSSVVPLVEPQRDFPCGLCRDEPLLCIGHIVPEQQHAIE